MKTYLSYGGGINSTAMLLLLHNEKWQFETIYVDHGCDWPETREYVRMLQEHYPITILTPKVQQNKNVFTNLYDYCWYYKVVPQKKFRWCTAKFKIKTIKKYCETPSFQLIGFDVGEKKRIKINHDKGFENRYPLIEYEIDRNECKKIIKKHGFPIPIKSGCFICSYQRVSQWKELRRVHPELYCKAKKLEDRNLEYQKEKYGKIKYYLCGNKPLEVVINEKQGVLWNNLKPPCSCLT